MYFCGICGEGYLLTWEAKEKHLRAIHRVNAYRDEGCQQYKSKEAAVTAVEDNMRGFLIEPDPVDVFKQLEGMCTEILKIADEIERSLNNAHLQR